MFLIVGVIPFFVFGQFDQKSKKSAVIFRQKCFTENKQPGQLIGNVNLDTRISTLPGQRAERKH